MRFAILVGVVLAFGCTKKPKAEPSAGPSPIASGGGGSTNYQAGGGAAQNVRQAARRTIALNDLKNLGQLVEVEYNDTGKMPTADGMKAIAKQMPNLAAAIEDGSLVVTGTTDHGGVWAYEADAPEKGGLALVGGTPGRYDSLDLAAKLKQ